MGGDLTATSTLGQGSTFRLTLKATERRRPDASTFRDVIG
jgi:signal transduction histidine kinase